MFNCSLVIALICMWSGDNNSPSPPKPVTFIIVNKSTKLGNELMFTVFKNGDIKTDKLELVRDKDLQGYLAGLRPTQGRIKLVLAVDDPTMSMKAIRAVLKRFESLPKIDDELDVYVFLPE